MARNISFTVCVQALDDFDPIPPLEDRNAMLKKAVEEFRAFLTECERRGEVIIGFRLDQQKDT